MTGVGRSFASCDFSGEFAVGPVRTSVCTTVSVERSSSNKKTQRTLRINSYTSVSESHEVLFSSGRSCICVRVFFIFCFFFLWGTK